MRILFKFYFEGLFTSEVHTPSNDVMSKVPSNITTKMNQSSPFFTEDEVKRLLF
jgi:hypothetical protein